MTNAELSELNKKRRIFQIAFLVYDVEKSMQKWIDLLNVGPWLVVEMNEKNCKNVIEKGKPSTEPFKFYSACTMMGDTQIELIQPVFGVSAYEEYMKNHGESLHHIKEYIPDAQIEEETRKYGEKGLNVIRQGHYVEDIHIYLNTLSELGFQLELGNCPKVTLTEDMYYMYPREK